MMERCFTYFTVSENLKNRKWSLERKRGDIDP